MRKNILMFASCERSFNEQKNVYNKLQKEDCNVIFIFSQEKITQYPTQHSIGNFSFACNFEIEERDFKYSFNSIGTSLPFIPDIVLISRESWQPETNIIEEFKRVGSIITCIENSSWLYNNIKTRLEILSRFRYPTNCIDVFFEHSNWSLETKKLAGWVGNKSLVVGIPKFDRLISELEPSEQKYIIVYGSMEKNIRPRVLEVLNEIKSNKELLTKFTLCYRPHPKEFEDFSESFRSELFHGIQIIDKEEILPIIVSNSVYNIGIFSSVMMYPLLQNKKILYIDASLNGTLDDIDFEKFKGDEYEFWKRIINVDSFEAFKQKVGESRVSEFLVRYNSLIEKFKESTIPYSITELTNENTENMEYSEIIKYFDEYNDGNASERITNYLLGFFN